MSDIDLSGLGRALEVIFTICIMGPSILIGLVLLLIGRFIPNKRLLLTTLYFALSACAALGIFFWLSHWFDDLEIFYFGVSMGIGSTVLVFGVYLLVRLIIRKVFARKRVSNP